MPDINDLYNSYRVSQAFLDSDPCSGANPIKSLNECSRTGFYAPIWKYSK